MLILFIIFSLAHTLFPQFACFNLLKIKGNIVGLE